MQDGIPIRGKGRNERGTFNQAHLLITKRMQAMMQSCRYYTSDELVGRGQRHEQGKSTTTDYYLLCTVTYSVFTYQTRRHNIHSKEQDKATLKRRERQTGSVDLYGVELG